MFEREIGQVEIDAFRQQVRRTEHGFARRRQYDGRVVARGPAASSRSSARTRWSAGLSGRTLPIRRFRYVVSFPYYKFFYKIRESLLFPKNLTYFCPVNPKNGFYNDKHRLIRCAGLRERHAGATAESTLRHRARLDRARLSATRSAAARNSDAVWNPTSKRANWPRTRSSSA